MKLEQLGWDESRARDLSNDDFLVARIVQEHKERYVVRSETGSVEAEITGKLRFTANSREDFPAVGDWVLIRQFDEQLAIIHEILPRRSVLARKSVSTPAEQQLIATNIDVAFVTQSLDANFNLNRIERYLSAIYEGNIQPFVLLTKSDLLSKDELAKILLQVQTRHPEIPALAMSNISGEGLAQLRKLLEARKSYCLVGSSGVGKSTIINTLLDREFFRTNAISESTAKGRHTTTHRELVMLENGAILIDTPGMREFGIGDASGGIASTFDVIEQAARNCRYADCSHTSEPGCAVKAAITEGLFDENLLKNYRKLMRESRRFEESIKERRDRGRAFAKMAREVMNERKKKRL